MNGLDPIIASTLASRLDSVLGAVAGSAAGAAQTSGTQQAAVPAGNPSGTPASPPAASVEATLSNTALAVDAILRADSSPPGPVLSATPLVATPPGQPSALVQTPTTLASLAGSPNASVTTALLNQLAQTANTAAAAAPAAAFDPTSTLTSTGALSATTAASATTSTGSPLATSALADVAAGTATDPLVAALASALQQNVDGSGLFYESHLAQWLGGTRSTADLQSEPQSQLSGTGNNAAAANTANSAGTTAAENSSLSARVTNSLASLLGASATPAQNASAPLSATALADAAKAATSGSTDSNTAANAATLNPQAMTLVRQQLDMLSNQQFRWSGQAWPGTPMDWEVERRASDGSSSADAADAQTWRTKISIELPSLGRVDAELSLNAQQLSARISADPAGARTLIGGGADFRKRAQAAGLDLRGFQVSTHGAAAAAAADVGGSGTVTGTANNTGMGTGSGAAGAGNTAAVSNDPLAAMRRPGTGTS